jgi:16S rRNA (adenine1518-N6/adenine1519-N6)-dimethyltransferase
MPESPLASPSATRAVLARHGLALKKSLGQHFLIDDNVIGRIIALAGIDASMPVLEVGPGIGTLTAALCAVSGTVTAVERDRDLLPALEELTPSCPSLSVVNADAVTVRPEELESPLGSPVALVANLPYGVAATVVLRFFEVLPALRFATVMVQAEVADRMAASPGSKAYGSYTVKLRLLAEPAGRFAVPRTCFIPPPRVDSAVLRLDRVTRPEPPEVLVATARLADAAFAQRRKTLRNSLIAASGRDAAAIDAALGTAGIDGRRRAETLTPDEFVALASALL